MTGMPSLLNVADLRVEFSLPANVRIRALRGVHLQIASGICYGFLGESGSGKSTLARALMRLLPSNAKCTQGAIEFDGRDLLKLTDAELQGYRGKQAALIPQEPGLALNPVMKIGNQIAEVLRAHNDWPRHRYRSEAESLLESVGLSSAFGRRMYDAYPHQLSGGQQQRVLIAQAISCNPQLIIADEPTASLDADSAAEILRLLGELKSERKMALILVTHDPRILAGLADRVAVLYAGRIVEDAPAEVFFSAPRHPYSQSLLACAAPASSEWSASHANRLPTIPGESPDPERIGPGCEFAPRCDRRMTQCESQQPSPTLPSNAIDDRRVECHLYAD
jgi:oligopeptide/dipeptide ABC transporter ATP-binding protein